jgi:hypothetical protein
MAENVQDDSIPLKDEQGKGILLLVNLDEPEVKDPAIKQSSVVWSGANEISFKLLRCLEAVRDITKIFQVLVELDDPFSDKRWVKQTASPLYNLASGIHDMFNELEGNAKNYSILTTKERRELKKKATQFGEQVPLDNQSELKDVRDRIDSHVDKVAVITPDEYWEKVNLSSYLGWLRVCLEQLAHLLSLEVYGWTRDSGHPDVWSLMSVDGTVVDFYMQDGQPVAILSVTLAKSPKYSVLNELQNLVDLYNKVAKH